MMSSTTEFSECSRKLLDHFRWLGVSRHIIEREGCRKYIVKNMPKFNLFVYLVYNVNSAIKMIYLAILLGGGFGPTGFLDKIGNLDYFLCGVMIMLGRGIWDDFLHERICQILEMENEIYRKTGYPKMVKAKVETMHKRTIRDVSGLILLGCISLGIQFYTDPKYCSFTYSALESDSTFLRLLFCAHEMIFMAHAWSANASSTCMVTFLSDSLAATLEQLILVLHQLGTKVQNSHIHLHANSTVGKVISNKLDRNKIQSRVNQIQPCAREVSDHPPEVHYDSPQISSAVHLVQRELIPKFESKKGYDIDKFLVDFQRLSLATRIFNDGIAYKLGALILLNYWQGIASTCMAFQVLRHEGGGIGDIWFYLQDCLEAGFYTFRVFKHMGEVLHQAEELFLSIKQYDAKTVCSMRMTKEQRLRHRTFTKLSMKVGPVSMHKASVLNSMDSLVGYHLCVALW